MREKPYFRDWIESFKDPVMDAFVSDRSILSFPEPNSMRKTSDSQSLRQRHKRVSGEKCSFNSLPALPWIIIKGSENLLLS